LLDAKVPDWRSKVKLYPGWCIMTPSDCILAQVFREKFPRTPYADGVTWLGIDYRETEYGFCGKPDVTTEWLRILCPQ
jgi:hypothetical protein